MASNGSFKATSIQATDFSIWFDCIEGGPDQSVDDLAGVDVIIPGSSGFVPMPREKRGRTIVLIGWLKAASLSAFDTAEQALLALFDPEAATGTLSYDLDNGDTATIIAQALAVIPISERLGGSRRYTIRLVSGAPDWTIA